MLDRYAVHAVFCDDIRAELDGKATLIGVHMESIKVNGTAPAALPQIFLGIWLTYPQSDIPKVVKIVAKGDTLENPPFDITLHPQQDLNKDDGDALSSNNFQLVEFITNRWSPAFFSGDGKIFVDVYADEENIFSKNWPVIFTPSLHPQVPPAIRLTP